MWEPKWRTSGVPNLGDMVQCKMVHEITREMCLVQGIVAHFHNGFVFFVGENPNAPLTDVYEVLGWRKWLGPEIEHQYKKRAKQDAY